jgi:hypothetical protein
MGLSLDNFFRMFIYLWLFKFKNINNTHERKTIKNCPSLNCLRNHVFLRSTLTKTFYIINTFISLEHASINSFSSRVHYLAFISSSNGLINAFCFTVNLLVSVLSTVSIPSPSESRILNICERAFS